MRRTLVVRFRGIGDVLLTWFGLETLARSEDVLYCTSPQAAELFPEGWVDVVPYKWKDHPLTVRPKLPEAVTAVPHDRLVNLVNGVDWERAVTDYHTVSRARQFSRLMGVDSSEYVRPIHVQPDALEWSAKLIYQAERPLVLCQVDAMSPTRQWAYWPQLATSLMHRGYSVVWAGFEEIEAPEGVLNFAGRTTFAEWVALLSLSDVIVSTCTSAVHIGARLPGVKVVGIYGSTDYRIFSEFYKNVRPVTSYSLACSPCEDWQTSSRCYERKFSPWCLSLLFPNKVLKAVEEVL